MSDGEKRIAQVLAFAPKNGRGETHYPLPITHYLKVAALMAATMSGCGTITPRDTTAPGARAPDTAPAPARPVTPRGGGYYLDDGPGDNPPPNFEQIPD